VYWGNYGLTDNYGLPARLWSVADSNPAKTDHINTVENVFIQNPTPGLWTIRVRADNITQDGHTETPAGAGCSVAPACDVDFALVVSGVYATGACSLPGGGCIVTDLTDCLAQGGTFVGDGVACN
jgi:hypothetical protein